MDALKVNYKTFEIGKFDIHVRMLKDMCQYRDQNGIAKKAGICSAAWPIFGVVWPSGEILAHYMLNYHVGQKRILEVGCGIALASMVLKQRSADITATDYHPEAGRFLKYNVMLNKGDKIPFVRTGWDEITHNLNDFDIIIGSDLLYESNHAQLLSRFIDNHAKKHCDVIIVDPNRGHHARFSKKMVSLKFSYRQESLPQTQLIEKPFKGKILHYSR